MGTGFEVPIGDSGISPLGAPWTPSASDTADTAGAAGGATTGTSASSLALDLSPEERFLLDQALANLTNSYASSKATLTRNAGIESLLANLQYPFDEEAFIGNLLSRGLENSGIANRYLDAFLQSTRLNNEKRVLGAQDQARQLDDQFNQSSLDLFIKEMQARAARAAAIQGGK